MRITEYILGERIVLEAGPKDVRHRPFLLRLFLLSFLLPGAAGSALTILMELPLPWVFLIPWLSIIVLGGSLVLFIASTTRTCMRFRADQGTHTVEWDERSDSGRRTNHRVSMDDLVSLRIIFQGMGYANVSLALTLQERDGRPVGVLLPIDWLAELQEAVDFAYRIASILGFGRYSVIGNVDCRGSIAI